MDVAAVLARYDEQVRRRPVPDGAGGRVEVGARAVRVIDPGGGWQGVTWTDLDARSADATIADQVEAFAATGLPWEWKHHSHDTPPDLPSRLLAAGFTAGPAETLLVADLAGPDGPALADAPPPGTRLVTVVDDAGVAALVALHDAVFGGDHRAVGAQVRAGIAADPPTVAAVLAVADGTVTGGGVADGTVISGGRVELPRDAEVAGLWGGCTLPTWRGRGVFRAVVARRAAIARERGFRHLQVDATAMSRPVLERLGFTPLATTTPFTHPGG